ATLRLYRRAEHPSLCPAAISVLIAQRRGRRQLVDLLAVEFGEIPVELLDRRVGGRVSGFDLSRLSFRQKSTLVSGIVHKGLLLTRAVPPRCPALTEGSNQRRCVSVARW